MIKLIITFYLFVSISIFGFVDDNYLLNFQSELPNPLYELYDYYPDYSLYRLPFDKILKRKYPYVLYKLKIDFNNKLVSIEKLYRDNTLLTSYNYSELYDFLKDVNDLEMRKLWNKTFIKESSGYRKVSRRVRNIRFFNNKFHSINNSEAIFGKGRANFDYNFDITAGAQGSKTINPALSTYNTTSNSSNSMDVSFKFDFNGYFRLNLGSRLHVKLNYAGVSMGAWGSPIDFKLWYGSDDSTELEDNILQEATIDSKGAIALPSLKLVNSGGFNNLFTFNVKTKLGYLNNRTFFGVDQGSDLTDEYRGGLNGVDLPSSSFSTLSYYFLDSLFASLYRNRDDIFEKVNIPYNKKINSNSFELFISTVNDLPEKYSKDIVFGQYKDYTNGKKDISFQQPERFLKIDKEYYTLYVDSGYIKLNYDLVQNLSLENRTVCVYYNDNGNEQLGMKSPTNLGVDTLWTLKLIKPSNSRSITKNHPYFRYYRWTNAYKIPIENYSIDKLKIFRLDENNKKIEMNGNLSYGEILGITSASGEINKRFIDRDYLILPSVNQKPFANKKLDIIDSTIYDTLYTHNDDTYILEFISNENVIKLPHTPIKSINEIRAGGVNLQKDVDYQLDEYDGTVKLTSATAINNAGDLYIKYTYQPFAQSNSVYILGNYSWLNLSDISSFFGDRSSLNYLTIFKSISNSYDYPELGKEPYNNFINDVSLKLGWDIPLFTKLANKLPGVKTKSDSKIDFVGEFAKVSYNPNTSTEGYSLLENFENSENEYNIVLNQTGWYPASKPSDIKNSRDSLFFWYNPYYSMNSDSIWPKQYLTGGSTYNTTSSVTVLNLSFPEVIDNNKYAGITKYISLQQGSDVSYLDVWVRTLGANGKPKGILNLDIGDISEDFIANDTLDYEGKKGNDNYSIDTKEDVGLDRLSDSEEKKLGIDPGYDNYSVNLDKAKTGDYINGYKNSNKFQGNNRRDSEDLNGNTFLDTYNDYYRFSVDLNTLSERDTNFIKKGINGWYHLIIPIDMDTLNDVFKKKIIGIPKRTKFDFMRIWVDSVMSQDELLQFASIKFIGSKWESIIKTQADSVKKAFDEQLILTNINTEDNPEYISPIPRKRSSSQSNVYIKEGAMNMHYLNIKPRHSAKIVKRYSGTWNMNRYSDLSFYVNSKVDVDSVFIRLTSAGGYYEIRFPIKSADSLKKSTNIAGWNDIGIDLHNLVQLKLMNQNEKIIGNYTYIKVNDPSLSSVNEIDLGIKNVSNKDISGNILFDEIRLCGAENKSGYGFYNSISANISDVYSASANMTYKDNFFHGLSERFGSGNSLLSGSWSNVFNLHKFYLEDYGFSIPLSVGFSRSVMRPSYNGDIFLSYDGLGEMANDYFFNGSHVTKSELYQTFANNQNMNISLSRKRIKKLKWIDYINPINVLDEILLVRSNYRFSYNLSQNLSYISIDTTKSYLGTWNINLGKSGGKGFKIINSKKPLKSKYFGTFYQDLAILPNWSLGINQNFQFIDAKNINLTDSLNDSKLNRQFRVNQNGTFGYNFFNILPVSFSLNTSKNLNDLVDDDYGVKKINYNKIVRYMYRFKNPGKIDGIFYNETTHDQNLNIDFDPKIFRFISNRVGYTSTFSQEIGDNGALPDSLSEHTINLHYNNQLSLNSSLNNILFWVNKRKKLNNVLKFIDSKKIKAISFNYTRQELYDLYKINEEKYFFSSYANMLSVQNGFSSDSRLFSNKKNRFFSSSYSDESQNSNIVRNNYSLSTGLSPLKKILVTWNPSCNDESHYYIDSTKNSYLANNKIFNFTMQIQNPSIFNGIFLKKSISSSFLLNTQYEYNFDSTSIKHSVGYNWTVFSLSGILKWHKSSFNISFATNSNTDENYSVLKSRTLYSSIFDPVKNDTVKSFQVLPEEKRVSSSNITKDYILNSSLSYKRNIKFFFFFKNVKIPVSRYSVSLPLSFKYSKGNPSLSVTKTSKGTFEFSPSINWVLWKPLNVQFDFSGTISKDFENNILEQNYFWSILFTFSLSSK